MCRRFQKDNQRETKCDGIDTVNKCPTGEVPKLSEENRKFKAFLFRMLPGLCDGFGGFNFMAIQYAMDVFGIARGQRPIVHDKMMQVIVAIEDIRKEKRKDR